MVARTACAHAIAPTVRCIGYVQNQNARIITHELRAHYLFLRITGKHMVARTACAHAIAGTVRFVGYVRNQ